MEILILVLLLVAATVGWVVWDRRRNNDARSHTRYASTPPPAPASSLQANPSRPQAQPARQPWAETLNRGAAELDRLIARGDWDSARDALQRIAYGMVNAAPDEKAAFTAAMSQFAARDPLVQRVLAITLPLVRQTPGLQQSKLYPHIPEVTPELVRYALYFAVELGQIERVKKGSSYALFEPGRQETEEARPQPKSHMGRLDSVKSFVTRGGESIDADSVFFAWTGGKLEEMLAVLDQPTNSVDRHHLLNCIVEAAYKRRKEPEMADLCARVAETYLSEQEELIAAIRQDGQGYLPRIPVFQQYATLLTERHQFDQAIAVCEQALRIDLDDGTQSGFAGRIARIKRAKAKHLDS